MHPPTGGSQAAVKYPPHSSLRNELNARVQAYFDKRGRTSKGGLRIWGKSALIFLWLASSYLLLVFWAETWWQAVPLTISVALAVAGIGFNVQHDGGHGAFSRRKLGNRLSAWTLDMVGGSSHVWNFKHTLIHHHYTNIQGVDDDIEAEPFLRLAPGQRRRWYHRFQHLYVWPLYGFFSPKWNYYDDFYNLIRGKVGSQPIRRPRGFDLVVFLAGKLFYVGWVLVLPLFLHPWGIVLALYALYCLALGITLATVFQLAHCVEEATFSDVPADGRRMDRCWAEHQLATTVDFSPRSRLLTWYLGGLNYQVVHHLFPRVSHVHYPALAPIMRMVCEERGVRYLSNSTIWAALRSHLRLLRRMGRPEPTVAGSGSS
jgi:linoleoyl-CoA desaturase